MCDKTLLQYNVVYYFLPLFLTVIYFSILFNIINSARDPTVNGGLNPLRGPVAADKKEKFKVRAVVTVKNKSKKDFKDSIVKHLDAFTDKVGRNVVLQLVSSEIDPKTKAPKRSNEAGLRDWSKKSNVKAERVNYPAEFMANSSKPSSLIGAIYLDYPFTSIPFSSISTLLFVVICVLQALF